MGRKNAQRERVQILLQKEKLLSATTLTFRTLQKPANFLQGLNRGW